MRIKDELYTNILRMFTGTVGAYVFWALAMLVIGRLYTPEYFGGGQLFVSAASILSVLATARYEKALTIPRFHFQAMCLLLFSAMLSIACTIGMFLLFWGFSDTMMRFLRISAENLFIVPFYTLELSIYGLFYAWMIRSKKYAIAAQGLVLFPVSYLIFCVVLHPFEIPMHRLALSIILARGMEILYYGYYLHEDVRGYIRKLSWQGILREGKAYADFPQYVLPGGLVEAASLHAVPFLITTFWGLGATGFYSMAAQVFAASEGLVMKSVGGVFRQEGGRLYGKYRECRAFYRKILKVCVTYSASVCISIYIAVPVLVPLFLGERWRIAGQYVQIMIPMTFMTLISLPLLDMYNIARQQRQYLMIQVAFLASSVIGIGVVGEQGGDIGEALKAWGWLTMMVSGISIYRGWRIARGGEGV